MLIILPAAALSQSTDVSVRIEALKYDPSPAEPGKFVDLWVSLASSRGMNLYGYTVEFVPSYPFYLGTGETATREFSVIGTNGVVAKYRLGVAEDAPSAESFARFRVYKTGASDGPLYDVAVNVVGKIDVGVKSVYPNELRPGNPTKVVFTFENLGNAPIRDLTVTWADANKKILPLGSENRFKIRELAVGATKDVEFSMIADPGIAQGVHVVDVNMTLQRFGVPDTIRSQVAFIVGGVTDFDVAQQDLDGDTVSLSVANIGVSTATGVLIDVPEQSGWDILGGSSVFLGNLDSGDFTVASVDVRSTTEDRVKPIKVEVKYTDTTGVRRTVEKMVSLNLASVIDGKKSAGPDYTTYIVALIVLAAGAWLLNRRFHFLRQRKHGKW
jgi:hypothetical protein